MSTLTVTTINTANGTTDLTLESGNTSGPDIVISSADGIQLSGNATTNTVQLYSNGQFVVSNTTANTLAITSAGATTIGANTLNLGSSSIAANGYTYLPNGLKFQWFNAAVTNAAAQAIAFPTAFGTNAYNIQATVGPTTSATAAQTIKVAIANGSHITANSIGVNTTWYFAAIGL